MSNSTVPPTEVQSLISKLYKTLSEVGKEQSEPVRPEPAVPPAKSVFNDHIVCLEDGRKLKMLKRHLMAAFNLTPQQYRAALGPAGQLSDGGAGLRQAALVACQEDRTWQAARRAAQVAVARPSLG